MKDICWQLRWNFSEKNIEEKSKEEKNWKITRLLLSDNYYKKKQNICYTYTNTKNEKIPVTSYSINKLKLESW